MGTEKIEAKESSAVKEVMSLSAIDRRRALLRGVGKGAAVLGATVPLKALATLPSGSVFTYNGTGTATQIRCGISGMTSGVHSRDITTTQCMGYSPGWWGQENNQSPGVPRRTWPVPYNVPYTDKFPTEVLATINGRVPTLFEVMNLPTYSNSTTRHWIGAYLNAMGGAPSSWNFPYSGQRILNFYNGTDPTYTNAQAYSFLTTYMEKHSGSED